MLKIDNYEIDKVTNNDVEFIQVNAKNNISLFMHNGNIIKLECNSMNNYFNAYYIDYFFEACIELSLKQVCYLLF